MNKLMTGALVVALTAGVSMGAALTTTTFSQTPGTWETAGNWSLGAVPVLQSQDLKTTINSAAVATMSSAATVGTLVMGDGGTDNLMPTLILNNGANLKSGWHSDDATGVWTGIGYSRAATVTVNAGATLECRYNLIIGRQGRQTDAGNSKASYLNIDGGSVLVATTVTLGNDNVARKSGGGVITIDNGGLLNAQSLVFWNANTIFQSYVQLNQGTMILNGNVNVQAMIDGGTLKGSNLSWDYDITNAGKTTVVPEPATIGMLGLGAMAVLAVRRIRRRA